MKRKKSPVAAKRTKRRARVAPESREVLEVRLAFAEGQASYFKYKYETLLASSETERRELYTRIQMWEAPPLTVGSQPPKEVEATLDSDGPDAAPYSAAELAAMKLVENTDGGFIHEPTNLLYDSPAAFKAMQGELERRGLKPDTDPRTIAEFA